MKINGIREIAAEIAIECFVGGAGFCALRVVTNLNPLIALINSASSLVIGQGLRYVLGREHSKAVQLAQIVVNWIASAAITFFISNALHMPVTFTACLYVVPLSIVAGGILIPVVGITMLALYKFGIIKFSHIEYIKKIIKSYELSKEASTTINFTAVYLEKNVVKDSNDQNSIEGEEKRKVYLKFKEDILARKKPLEIFDLPKNYSKTDLTGKYRKLALYVHPDHNPSRKEEAHMLLLCLGKIYDSLLIKAREEQEEVISDKSHHSLSLTEID